MTRQTGDQKTTGRVLACAAIGLALTLCLAALAAAGVGAYWFVVRSNRTAATPPVVAATTPTAPPTAEPAAAVTPATPEPEPATPVPLPPALEAQLDEIENQVIGLRGLPSIAPVPHRVLTVEELRQIVVDDFLEDYTADEARADALGLSAFGLLEPGFDLYAFYADFLTEQVAGFFDDETGQIYLIGSQQFGGPERLTYSHEFGHALQFQNYDVEAMGYSDEACEDDSERCAAIRALIEGDATLLQLLWLQAYATPQDLEDIQAFYATYESPATDSAPAFLQQDFYFPYEYGLPFVQSLYESAGWPGVDGAYADLPVSTEQILHPERYPADRPRPVSLPALESALGPGWREVDEDVLGEWYTRLVLQAYLPADLAEAAAEGWGGDAYRVLYDDAASSWVLVLRTVWDTQADADEFARAFADYSAARFDGGGLSLDGAACRRDSAFGLSCILGASAESLWIIAPDEATVEAVRGAVEFP